MSSRIPPHHIFRDQGLKSTDNRISAAFSSSSSSSTGCPTCIGPGSSIEHSPIGSECTPCLSDPNAAGCCRFPANAEEHHNLSGCIEPGCPEAICNECLEHDEYCDECGVDCVSDCGIPFDCDELDIRVDDTYSFEGSHSELFGDQTAQTFGFGRPLPQLAMENPMIESDNFGKIVDDTTLSTHPGYSVNQIYPGPRLQPNRVFRVPRDPHPQPSPPHATSSSRPSYRSAFPGLQSQEPIPPNLSHLPHNSPPFTYSADSPHDPTDFTPNAHYDHINLLTERSDSTNPTSHPLRCQWADSNGEPCGMTLGLGNDMHEHLKTAHGVKNEVFCRWVGCAVGVLGAHAHRFASSVERHTWGHSGYRPYKCSACNEGFAAASVRDEHYTNIHLRKKVYSCDMCSHQCTSATNLKRHKDDKHSTERFQCEFCNRIGKRRLFPRGPNLARHFRNCKYVQAQFPEAAVAGKAKADWLPPGYKRGHHGMDRAKVTPPNYLPAQNDV